MRGRGRDGVRGIGAVEPLAYDRSRMAQRSAAVALRVGRLRAALVSAIAVTAIGGCAERAVAWEVIERLRGSDPAALVGVAHQPFLAVAQECVVSGCVGTNDATREAIRLVRAGAVTFDTGASSGLGARCYEASVRLPSGEERDLVVELSSENGRWGVTVFSTRGDCD